MSDCSGRASGVTLDGKRGRKKRWMWQQQAQMHSCHRDASCLWVTRDRKRFKSVQAEQQSLRSSVTAPHPG